MKNTNFRHRPWTYCPTDSHWFIPAVRIAARQFLGHNYASYEKYCTEIFADDAELWKDTLDLYEAPEGVAVFALRMYAMEYLEGASQKPIVTMYMKCLKNMTTEYFAKN